MDCGSAADAGYDITHIDISEQDAYKVRVQCLDYAGKFVQLVGGDPRRIRPVPIESGGDGIYTYLFDGAKTLYTAKVANQFEIGSLHLTLAFLAKTPRVLAAGELRLTGPTVEFNLLSGTFMEKWMVETLRGACDTEIISQTTKLFTAALPGKKHIYTDEHFITSEKVPVTREQLNVYLDAGFEVRLYDTKGDCKLNPDLLRAKLAAWKNLPPGPHIQKAEEDLARSLNFTLYTRAGRRITRRRRHRR
jgi:hypothetical protein